MSLIDSINVLYSAYNKMMNRYCKTDGYHELTVANYQYLIAIFEAKQITITDLSKSLGVKKASTTQMIDGLLKKGYVKKIKSDSDKRSAFIELSEKGSKLIESEDNVYKLFTERISRSLRPEEMEFLEEILNRLAKEVHNIDSE